MSEPLLPWESENTDHLGLVWRSKLDNRYLVEVHRANTYQGKLLVFDHKKNDQQIACWDVNLLYGAIFGADNEDINKWMEKVANFIDNIYNKQEEINNKERAEIQDLS